MRHTCKTDKRKGGVFSLVHLNSCLFGFFLLHIRGLLLDLYFDRYYCYPWQKKLLNKETLLRCNRVVLYAWSDFISS